MNDHISLFVPGRLCLFGEHSDWAGLQRIMNASIMPGMAIVTGIEQGVYANVEKNIKFVLKNEANELKDMNIDFECNMNTTELRIAAESGSFYAYVAGVASYICENYHIGGIKITITKMTLPIKSGLSSSAAICVLVTRAFNQLYMLNLNTIGEMAIAFKGEQRTQSRCGRLDQACAFGVKPVLMTFDGEDIKVDRLIVKEPLYWVFANINGSKDTIRILSDLNKCYPFAQNAMENNVHSALGEDNHRIINNAVHYIKTGDYVNLGKLMNEAQDIFDKKVAPASWAELKAPILHSILNDKIVASLSYGRKGVGSQGDGSVQFLAKDADCQLKLVHYLNNENNDCISAYALTIKPSHRVHKAIIPVVGYGTQLFPYTRKIKKEFFPIIDSECIVKPAILILLDQLYASGIDEICLIVNNENDINAYKEYFHEPILDAQKKELPISMIEQEIRIKNIGKILSFTVTNDKKGLGNAILQCKDFCGDESVLLIFSDTLYKSNSLKTCSEQLIEAYEQFEKPLISIRKTLLNDISRYGCLSGIWQDNDMKILKIKHIKEKPDKQYAENYLGVRDVYGNINYFKLFGQYIITPDIFNEISQKIMNNLDNNEVGITEVMEVIINSTELYGIELNGDMFTLETIEDIKNTVNIFQNLPISH